MAYRKYIAATLMICAYLNSSVARAQISNVTKAQNSSAETASDCFRAATQLLKDGVFASTGTREDSQLRSAMFRIVTADEETFQQQINSGDGNANVSWNGIKIGARGSSTRERIEKMRRQYRERQYSSIDQFSFTEFYSTFADKNLLDAFTKTMADCNKPAPPGQPPKPTDGLILEVLESGNSSVITFRFSWHKPNAIATNLPNPKITSFEISNIREESQKNVREFLKSSEVTTAGQSITVLRNDDTMPVVYNLRTDIAGDRSGYFDPLKDTPDETRLLKKFQEEFGADPDARFAVTEGVFDDKIRIVWRRNDDMEWFQIYRTEVTPPRSFDRFPADYPMIADRLTGTSYDDTNIKKGQKYTYVFAGKCKDPSRCDTTQIGPQLPGRTRD